MLKKGNPTHKILVKYFHTVNPNVETGVLLEIETGYSKPSKKTKSDEDHVKATKSKSSPKNTEGVDTKNVEDEAQPLKEVVSSKS